MIQIEGRVHIEEASRYLQRLCFHFSRKIPVQYNEHEGNAEFPWGRCQLIAQDSVLSFNCEAVDEASLARIQVAIDSQVSLFSRKNPVQVNGSASALLNAPAERLD